MLTVTKLISLVYMNYKDQQTIELILYHSATEFSVAVLYFVTRCHYSNCVWSHTQL